VTTLAVAAAAFILLHLLVSGTRLRDALTGAIGEGPYQGLFSLASVACLAWLIIAFGPARSAADNQAFWAVTPLTRDIQLGLTLLAFLLVVPGLTTPNPTSVRQQGVLDKPDAIRGMLRITRHPFLWGVAIWAAGHLLVHGDVAAMILFGSLLMLALFGTASIDAKRRRALGARWDAFAAKTSNIPFAAILARRQKLKIGEIGWWRLVLAVVLWVAMLYAHPYAFGVRALP
jgi:uncharacterized membrane protein